MGNCVEAWERTKQKKTDKVTKEMVEIASAEVAQYRAIQEQNEGLIRERQNQYNAIVQTIKARGKRAQPTEDEVAALKALKMRMHCYAKQNETWVQKELRSEETKTRLAHLQINSKLLTRKAKFADGFKKLKKLGVDPTKAEAMTGSEEDARDEIDEFNQAFSTDTTNDMSTDEIQALEDQIRDQFNGGGTKVHLPKVPTRQLMSPSEELSDEIELEPEAIVIDTD